MTRRIGWRARYVDPDTGKSTKETLDAALRTAELRDEWAVRRETVSIRVHDQGR